MFNILKGCYFGFISVLYQADLNFLNLHMHCFSLNAGNYQVKVVFNVEFLGVKKGATTGFGHSFIMQT